MPADWPLHSHSVPQVAENKTPLAQDAFGVSSLYDESMTRVYLADARPEERSALRVLLLDLNMQLVGEAADWATTLAQAPILHTEILLVDWDLIPGPSGEALSKLRTACPAAPVIVLISHLDARHQAALSAGADAFISKNETPERLADHLRAAAASVLVR